YFAIADVLKNGRPAVIVADKSSNRLSLLLGNGDGTFQSQITLATGNHPYSVTVGDLDGDGKPDMAVLNSAAENVSVFLNRTQSVFTGQTYTIDQVAPFVVSINRTTPAGPNTNAASVTFTVTFSEAVTGVDASDFQMALTGG